MNTLIKFNCDRCGQEMEGDSDYEFQKVTCPNCQAEFFPKPKKILRQLETKPTQNIIHDLGGPAAPVSGKFLEADLTARRKKIRGQAASFTLISFLFLGGSIITTIVSLNDPHEEMGLIIAGSLLSFALWFFLVAQIIHIRANTEK